MKKLSFKTMEYKKSIGYILYAMEEIKANPENHNYSPEEVKRVVESYNKFESKHFSMDGIDKIKKIFDEFCQKIDDMFKESYEIFKPEITKEKFKEYSDENLTKMMIDYAEYEYENYYEDAALVKFELDRRKSEK